MAGMGRAQRGFQYTCLLLTALMLGLGVMSLGRLQLNNDILALFPGLDEHSAEAEANRLRAGSIEREILLLVYSSDQSRLHDTLPAVVENLKRCDCFAEVAARLADLGGGRALICRCSPVLAVNTSVAPAPGQPDARAINRSGSAATADASRWFFLRRTENRPFGQPGRL